MADTLEIFGKEFQNVTGIIATDDNGNELTYTRGGSSDFIVTVGYDPDDDKWYMNESYSDVASAVGDGKNITFQVGDFLDEQAVADGYWDNGTIRYRVNYYNFDSYKYYQDEFAQTSNALSSVTRTSHEEMYPNPVYKDSSDLVVSGQYVSVPVGVYENIAWAQVASGSVTAPSSISGTSASVSTGTNTLTLSKTISVTPNVTTAGYVSSGTAGNSAVSLTASVTTKGAATITPGTTDQTIASSTYLTGAQTIKGDANLLAGNIKKDVVIFNTTGTYTGGGGSGLDLLATLSMGTISTSSTQAASTGKTVSVSSINSYDALVVETSVNTKTNGRHAATIGVIWLTASSAVGTKDAGTIATAKWNCKLSSTGTATTRASTTAYGIYPYSITISSGTASIPMYQRYNSTQTGTINGTYTARVYGLKLYDLIGG